MQKHGQKQRIVNCKKGFKEFQILYRSARTSERKADCFTNDQISTIDFELGKQELISQSKSRLFALLSHSRRQKFTEQEVRRLPSGNAGSPA